jgi:hypothetical protein
MNIETSNNSIEMNTIVETFIIEETVELIYDNEKLDKWNNLVAELELKGQETIRHPEKSPIPFMHLKTSMYNVLDCLCPRKVDISQYDVTPIPVEILDLISLSKKEHYFNKVQIWYDEKNPDPCCVGETSEWYTYDYSSVPVQYHKTTFKTKEEAIKTIQQTHPEFDGKESMGWETNQKYYLLGKWADVKHSFEELKVMATKRFMEQESNDFKKAIKEAERGLLDLETKAFEKFN